MTESTLAAFLSGGADAATLRADLVDVVGTNTLRSGQNLIMDLSREVAITCDHLVRLCDACLSGNLGPEHLQAIALLLIGSDNFVWDTRESDGALIADVIAGWATPEINYPLTHENIARYRAGLLERRYAFPRDDTAR